MSNRKRKLNLDEESIDNKRTSLTLHHSPTGSDENLQEYEGQGTSHSNDQSSNHSTSNYEDSIPLPDQFSHHPHLDDNSHHPHPHNLDARAEIRSESTRSRSMHSVNQHLQHVDYHESIPANSNTIDHLSTKFKRIDTDEQTNYTQCSTNTCYIEDTNALELNSEDIELKQRNLSSALYDQTFIYDENLNAFSSSMETVNANNLELDDDSNSAGLPPAATRTSTSNFSTHASKANWNLINSIHPNLKIGNKNLVNSTLTNVKLILDYNKEYHCHDCVLAASSDYFKCQLLNKNWTESKKKIINLEGHDNIGVGWVNS